MFLLYPSLTELPSIEINWALQDVSELGYLFHDKSSLHIVAWDLDVERSQLYNIVLDDVKAGMISNPVTQWRICYYKYALTTVKGASVK